MDSLSQPPPRPPQGAGPAPLPLSFQNCRGHSSTHGGQTHSLKEGERKGTSCHFTVAQIFLPKLPIQLIHSSPRKEQVRGKERWRALYFAASFERNQGPGRKVPFSQHKGPWGVWQFDNVPAVDAVTNLLRLICVRDFLMKPVIVTLKTHSVKVVLTEDPTARVENSDFQKESFTVHTFNKYNLQSYFSCDQRNKLLTLELKSSLPTHLTIVYPFCICPSIRLLHCSGWVPGLWTQTSHVPLPILFPAGMFFSTLESQSSLKEILRFPSLWSMLWLLQTALISVFWLHRALRVYMKILLLYSCRCCSLSLYLYYQDYLTRL